EELSRNVGPNLVLEKIERLSQPRSSRRTSSGDSFPALFQRTQDCRSLGLAGDLGQLLRQRLDLLILDVHGHGVNILPEYPPCSIACTVRVALNVEPSTSLAFTIGSARESRRFEGRMRASLIV